MKEESGKYVDYRLKRAEETFEDAQYLAREERWNSCINRLYYACFYAVIAALLKTGIEAQTHNGVKSQFTNLFIKTKILSPELGKHYAVLFDFRQKGDYGDLFDFQESKVKPLIPPTENFIEQIKKYIEG